MDWLHAVRIAANSCMLYVIVEIGLHVQQLYSKNLQPSAATHKSCQQYICAWRRDGTCVHTSTEPTRTVMYSS